MKLIRFGEFENEKPGVELPDGTRIDVSEHVTDYNEAFFKNDGIKRLKNWVSNNAKTAPRISVDV